MPLGFENIKGTEWMDNINLGGFASGANQLFIILGLFILAGGILFTFLYISKNKKLYSKNLHFFEEINGEMAHVEDCKAAELTIPQTNIKVFYVKTKNMYLPRGTRRMGKNSYWYCIRNNKEIINFVMTNLNKEMKEAKLEYDHTDMRYALANLKELIKRNYRDKSKKWWQEYRDVIAVVVFVFVMSLSFFFTLKQMGNLVGDIGNLISRLEPLIHAANSGGGSGVIMQ